MTVLQQQCLLTYLGYSPGAIDGVWGPQTASAIRQFQQDYSLPADGICGAVTEKMLIGVVAGTVAKKEKQAISDNVSDNWWDEFEYITREECKCKCGGRYCNGYPAEMQYEVVKIANDARKHFGKPAHVISGLRCQQWNAHEGGVANSQHMFGEAIDLCIDGVDSETLRQFVSRQPNHRYSYRINSTNVHFDIPAKAR